MALSRHILNNYMYEMGKAEITTVRKNVGEEVDPSIYKPKRHSP